MSVTCPRISTLELAGHPARSINHSLFFAVVRNKRPTENRSPFILHFRPLGIESHGEHVPRHLARKELSSIHCKPVPITAPDCKRSGTTTKKGTAGKSRRSFVPFVRYFTERSPRPFVPYFAPWDSHYIHLAPFVDSNHRTPIERAWKKGRPKPSLKYV